MEQVAGCPQPVAPYRSTTLSTANTSPFVCSCGKKLRVNKPVSGKRLRCPACGAVVTPPAPPQPHAVFISHSAKDNRTATLICSALEERGIRCWMAPRDIVAGKEWGEAIIDGIGTCRIMVIIFSGHSNQSPQVRREVERAVSKGVIIVPFRIENVPMAKSLEYFLSSPHWLDALTLPLEPHVAKLVRTVQTLLRDGLNAKAEPGAASLPISLPTPPRKSWARRLTLAGAGVGALALALVAWLMWNRQPPAGAQAANPEVLAARSSPSEIPMRDGTLHVRSLGLEVRADGLEKPLPFMVVSNLDPSAKWPTQFSKARLKFQITNNSFEAATLAKVEVALLGIVDLYEDRIAEPRPPSVLKAIESRDVKFGRARTLSDLPDLKTVFQDTNDPPSPLKYETATDLPEVAKPRLDPQNRLEIDLPGEAGSIGKSPEKMGGLATINIRAINAFDLSVASKFTINSVPRPPRVLKTPAPRQVEISGPQTWADAADAKTLFEDADNDPPTPLKYDVTSDLPDVAKATLDPQGKLQITLPGKVGGNANITMRATNKYNLAATVSFPVNVKIKVKTGTPANVHASPKTVPSPVMMVKEIMKTGNPANTPLGIGKFEVDKEVLYLTNVQFAHSLKRHDLLRPCTSGNLLPGNADIDLPANKGKRLSVDIDCPTTWELPAHLPGDLLAGTRERRLAARAPEFVGTCHLLVVMVEVMGEDGKRHELYGDRVYAVFSYSMSSEPAKNEVKQIAATALNRGEDKSLDDALAHYSSWCLKTHAETIAFQRAKICGAVPDNFDPLTLSPRCFYGDRTSAFRTPGSVTPPNGPQDAWPRTNFVEVLDQARQAHPELWKAMAAGLEKTPNDPQAAVARRLTYVAEQLRSLPPPAKEPIKSLPPRQAPVK